MMQRPVVRRAFAELWPAVSALILGLCLLAAGVNVDVFVGLNRSLRFWPDPVWNAITLCGDTLLALALVAPVVRSRAQAWLLLLTGILATALTHLLKPGLDVPRPAAVLADAYVVGPTLLEHSFPSGHTATVFALAGYLVLRGGPRWRWLALLPAALVGLSRIAVGAHWPLDVAGGAAVGWFGAWAAIRLGRRWTWDRHPTAVRWAAALTLAQFVWLLARPALGLAHERAIEGGLALVCLVLVLYGWRRGRSGPD